MFKKLKSILNNINNKYFFGKYSKDIYHFQNKSIKLKDYLLKFIIIYAVTLVGLILIFPNIIHSLILSFIITIFLINQIILNAKKIEYQRFELSQLTIYANQVSMFITYNNVYSSLKETVKFLSHPIKKDLEKVIINIDNGETINNAFLEFNEKYNNKTITLFNQSLDLFDDFGSSEAGKILHLISDELNHVKIKKDRFYRFKKEWRLNFYVVVFMCLAMPIILKMTIPDIYINFMQSFGMIVMLAIFIFNLFIINKTEKVYADLSIGEEGYR